MARLRLQQTLAVLACAAVLAAQACLAQVPTPGTFTKSHISHLVDIHNQYALSLAERGACLTAEQEYYKALWVVARQLDTTAGSNTHCEALAAVRCAFDESDDFASYLPHQADADVRPHMVGHKTMLLRDSPQPVTPLVALQAYYQFAGEQLILAVGDEPRASQSLSGLAQIQAHVLVEQHESTAPAKAIALFQSAISVDPTNALAANELGVLLTKYGRLEAAKQAFLQSLRAAEQPNTWHNLAKIHERLGENELAAQARARMESLKQQRDSLGNSTASIKWVDSTEFVAQARSTNNEAESRTAATGGRLDKQTPNQVPLAEEAPADSADGTEAKVGLLDKVLSITKWRNR